MTMTKVQIASMVGVLIALAIASCCTCPPVHPDFAGVPDSKSRTGDFALPLDNGSRQSLQRALVKAEGVPDDPGSEAAIATRYQDILESLSAVSMTFEELSGEGNALRRAAASTWRMRVNDAREEHASLDITNAFAIIGGGFAWVVYRHHVNTNDGPMELVVFPRQFVLSTPAR
jgi:hypothetical protein